MKFLKKFISLILILLLVLVLTVAVLVFVVDFNEYKSLISTQVERTTGRKLDIEGDIRLAVWPWLGFQVENAELSNAPGFGDQPFARVDKFDLKLELMPLLQKQINIDKILLHGLTLSLQKNAQGQNNWEDLNRAQSPQAPRADTSAEAETSSILQALSIQDIEIKRGRLNWDDKQSQMQASLDGINLQAVDIGFNKNVPLTFSVHGKLNEPQIDVHFNLNTEINIDMENRHIAMQQADMELRLLSPKMAAQNTLIKATSSINASLKKQQYSIQNLVMDLNTKGYQLPGGDLDLKLHSAVLVDLQKYTAVMESIQLESMGMLLTASANLSQLDAEPVIAGELNLAEFNPITIANKYKINLPSMSDAQALQKMQAQFQYRASLNEIKLSKLSIKIDDSVIKGSGSIKTFKAPQLKYDLNLNTINLNRYLPTPIKASKKRSIKSVPLSSEPIDLPLDALRKLNVDGLIKANEITWQDYQFKKIYIKVRGKKGILVASPVNVGVFDGRMAMAAKLDVSNKQAKYSVNVKAQKLQLADAAKPVLENVLNEQKVSLKGVVDLNASLTTEGNSVHELVSELNGKLDFRSRQTQLNNVDFEHYLRQRAWYVLDRKIRNADRLMIAALNKHNFPTTERDFVKDYRPRDKTVFNVMRAKANINQGVVNNYEFLLASDRMNINGKGAIYLANQRMNYAAEIDLHRTHNSLKDEILDIPLTVNLEGPFNTLKPKPDTSAWLSKAWDAVVSKGKTSVKQKIKEKAKDKIKDKYKDMLKQWKY